MKFYCQRFLKKNKLGRGGQVKSFLRKLFFTLSFVNIESSKHPLWCLELQTFCVLTNAKGADQSTATDLFHSSGECK